MQNNTTVQKAMSYATALQQYIAIGYYRLSKEDLKSGESESIENQRDIVRNYCKVNNIALIAEFVDDGRSGLNTDRDGFQQALSVLNSGQCNMFLTKDLSRLSRDHIEADRFIEEVFPQLGIRYVAVDDNVDTLREYDIIVPFKNLFNEMSSRDTSKKVTHALQVKRERGEYCTRAPYGYKKDPNDNMHLIPDDRCDWVVKRIFALYAEGVKPKEICRILNNEGIPTPTEVRGWINPHDGRKNRHVKLQDPSIKTGWDKSTIYVILNNRVYLGDTILGKTRRKNFKKKISEYKPKEDWLVTPDTHEPLVSEALFHKCQLVKNARATKGTFRNIFSGFVFCDTCGAAMSITKKYSEKDGQEVRGLRCGTNIRFGAKGCQSHSIPYNDLVEVVKERLNYYLSMTQDERKRLVSSLTASMAQETEIEKIKRKITELKRKNERDVQSITAAITKSVEGLLGQSALDSMLKQYNQNMEARNRQIEMLEKELGCLDAPLDFSKFVNGLVEQRPIHELTREILEEFIERIEISHYELPKGKKLRRSIYGSCGQQIKIKYKFMPDIILTTKVKKAI